MLVIGVGIIFFLDREGYLQQYLNSEELKEKVSQKITPSPMGNETFKAERIPEVVPLAMEKIGVSVGAGKVADSSMLTRDVNGPKEADGPKAKTVKAATVRPVEKEKTKRNASRPPVASGRPAVTDSLPGERASSKKEESFDYKEKIALDSSEEKLQSRGSTTGQQTQETSSKQSKEVEPDKVIEWLLERRSDKK